MADHRSRRAVEVAERYADGLETNRVRGEAEQSARQAHEVQDDASAAGVATFAALDAIGMDSEFFGIHAAPAAAIAAALSAEAHRPGWFGPANGHGRDASRVALRGEIRLDQGKVPRDLFLVVVASCLGL